MIIDHQLRALRARTRAIPGDLARMSIIMLLVATFLWLAGCATAVQPRTFDERLAYAAGIITATRQSCSDLLQRQRLPIEDARACQARSDEGRNLVNLARAARFRGDEQTAQALLQALQQVTLALEAQLAANKGP